MESYMLIVTGQTHPTLKLLSFYLVTVRHHVSCFPVLFCTGTWPSYLTDHLSLRLSGAVEDGICVRSLKLTTTVLLCDWDSNSVLIRLKALHLTTELSHFPPVVAHVLGEHSKTVRSKFTHKLGCEEFSLVV